MADYDYSQLDLSGVMPMRFGDRRYLSLRSAAAVFGRGPTIRELAGVFMTSTDDVLDAILWDPAVRERNANARKLLHSTACAGDRASLECRVDGGAAPVSPDDRMRMELSQASKVQAVVGGARTWQYFDWQLGDVPLYLHMSEGFRSRLQTQLFDHCDTQQRATHTRQACWEPDKFEALRLDIQQISERTQSLLRRKNEYEETIKPMVKDMAMLTVGTMLLDILEEHPKEERSPSDTVDLREFKSRFERLHAAVQTGIVTPSRYAGVHAFQLHLDATEAQGLFERMQDVGFLGRVEYFVQNEVVAPPTLGPELMRCLSEAYLALATSTRADLAVDDLMEWLDATSATAKLGPDLQRSFGTLDSEWLKLAAQDPRGVPSFKSRKNALGILSKSIELPKKSVDVLQELVSAVGALIWKKWFPAANQGKFQLAAKFFRVLITVSKMKDEDVWALAKAVDRNQWQNYANAKGWGGKLTDRVGKATFVLFNMASLLLIILKKEQGTPFTDSEVANICKFSIGIANNSLKALKLPKGAFARTVATEVLDSVGQVFTIVTGYMAAMDDIKIDDTAAMFVHFGAAAGGLALIAAGFAADATVLGLPLGIVLKVIGVVLSIIGTIYDIYHFINDSFAKMWFKQALDEFKKSTTYYTLGEAQCKRWLQGDAPAMYYREPEPDAVANAFGPAYKMLHIDPGHVHPDAAAEVVALGFPEKMVEWITGERVFAWDALKEAVTFVK